MKKILLVLSLITVFVACQKQKSFLEEPTYTNLKIQFIGSQYYRVSLDGAIIADSLSSSRGLNQFVKALDDQQLKITNITTQEVVVDSTIDLPHSPTPEFIILEIDAQTRPLFISGKDLLTDPPTGDSLKFNFLNLDTGLTKGKSIDLAFYQFAASTYTLKGEIKNILYASFSHYVQLPSTIPTLFFEIKNSETGQIILAKETRNGRLNRPGTYRTNNIFTMLFKGNSTSTIYTPSILIQQHL